MLLNTLCSGAEHFRAMFFQHRLDLLWDEFLEREGTGATLFEEPDRVLPLDAAEIGFMHEITQQPLQFFGNARAISGGTARYWFSAWRSQPRQ